MSGLFAAPTMVTLLVLSGSSALESQSIRNMTLAEDLRIKSDESSRERSLTHVHGLVVLSDGKIVSAHGSEGILRVFDSTGRFIRTLGRLGDGPGEFRGISSIGSWRDSVWVHDIGKARVTIFSTSGGDPRIVAPPLAIRREHGDFAGFFGNDQILYRKNFRTTVAGQMAYISQEPPHDGVVSLNWVHDSVQFSVASASGDRSLHVYTWRHDKPARYLRANMNGERAQSFPEIFQPMVTAIATTTPSSAKLLIDADLWNGRPGEVRVVTVGSSFRADTSTLRFPARVLTRSFADGQVKRIASGFATSYFEGNVNVTEAAAFEAEVRRKIFVPTHIPVVSAALAGADGSIWINDRFDRRTWLVVSSSGALSTLRMPANVRLVQATLRRVWGVGATADDVPILVRYAVR